MKRQTTHEIGVFLLLASLGVGLRLYFQFIPNFAPVAGLALFAGYYFRSRAVAVALPLAVMAVTDFFIGGHHPVMMATVYAALALPVLMRGMLRRRFALAGGDRETSWQRAAGSTAGLVGCSLGASAFFFVATNFAHWLTFGMYEKTAAGLLSCFTAALPFFQYTLAGDLTFACSLFGAYAVATAFARQPAGVVE